MNGKAIFQGGNAQSLNNIAGQPIAEYTHSKSGTVHKLVGPSKAKNVVFKATGDYNDGDTWMLNDKPITATYNGGEELLPTAVLTGDVVQAVVMQNQVKLMLQKPVPQESMLINWDFANPIIQRGLGEYAGSTYHVDMWSKDAVGIVKVDDTGLLMLDTDNHANWAIVQLIENLEAYKGQFVTFSVLASGDDGSSFCIGVGNGGGYTNFAALSSNRRLLTFTWKVNTDLGHAFVIRRGGTGTLRPLKAKLEIGNRFTGWPVWDYGAELEKCQRYALEMVSAFNTKFGEIGVGSASNATRAVIFCPIPVSFRAKPAVSFTGDFRLTESGARQKGIPVTSITINQVTANGVNLYVDTEGGLSAGKYYSLAFIDNPKQNSLFLNSNL